MIADFPVAGPLLLAAHTIQHRGQDAAGVGTWDERRVHVVKGEGLIDQAVPENRVPTLVGNAGISHVRYPTAGAVSEGSKAEDAQPFRTRQPGVLLAHNGNVTNVPELTAWLREQGHAVFSQCDAEHILLTLTTALLQRRPAAHTAADVVAAVSEVRRRVRGAYTVVAVLEVDGEPTLLAFRDPHGIRPGCYGQGADGGWVVASESVALDVLAVEKTDDLPVGELLLLRRGQPELRLPVEPTEEPRPCIFERVYFARPDSLMEDGRVNRTRWRMGRRFAQEWRQRGLEADIVVAVPDTSRPAAQAMAEELGIRHREGFIKNRYSGRTFIMPDQASRDAALRLKLNPIREMFEGRRVLLVDDSIVRGTTMRRIAKMVRDMGPKELHLAIFSPPVAHPCYYGIDMPTKAELVASQYPPDQLEAALAERYGVNSVSFLSVEGLKEVAGRPVCAACFDGDYVVPVSADEQAAIVSERRG
ncbi:MAG: amidophosphoribosyltransferase [Alphaproteobacteria bacterium]|nr:amidophosphoribosyltransferase [Alphaproteobacteria bacterium]